MNWADELEPGRCAACKALAEISFQFYETEIPCCFECKDDGSFTDWLAGELDKWAETQPGWTFKLGDKGQKIWTPPPQFV